MFDFIRKELLWAAWDAGHHREIGGGSYHLKTAQDLGVYKFLRPLSGQRIAEIGGGASRLLKRLSLKNECYNVEKFAGADGGPSDEIITDGVQNVKVFLGDFSPELQDSSFDVVFSVSVVEHVPDDRLSAFFEDGLRILKPGGLWLHAIDIYIEDEPPLPHRERFNAYKAWIKDPRVVPVGNIYEDALKFSATMASNPDQTMYNWGQTAPNLINLRKRAQSTSLLVAARKK